MANPFQCSYQVVTTKLAVTESFDDLLKTGGALNALPTQHTDLADKVRGTVLSGYRVGDVLGVGGMGYVLHAQRAEGDFDREVAIKVVEASHASSETATRFRQEVKILAQLNHKGIAQLLDAGETDTGLPYLVMEYINGSPIDEYCENQNLGLRARLALLLEIADAIQFAHAQLVVHRDLKPSNVLVDTQGHAKLLDFGIAMLLKEQSEALTRGGAMTPQYASPEQLLGKPISIGTDIYQFGLLMAKVLCGSLPGSEVALTDNIQRAAAGKSVQLSPEQRHHLPHELVLIIEQCLRAEPEERYRDATSLRQDLSAYLTGHPVSAAGQSKRYRLGKFVRRNWGAVLASSAAVLTLIAATLITTWQMFEANRQRDIAEYQQQRVQASSEFYSLLMEELGEGSYTSVELLDRGRSLLQDQFGTGQSFLGSVLFDVSRSYANLGEQDREAELLREAEAIAREHQDDNLLAGVLCSLAASNQVRNRESANVQLREGQALYNELTSPPLETSIACLRAESNYQIKAGQYGAALEVLKQAEALLEQHPAPGTNHRALILEEISSVYFYSRQTEESVAYLNKLLSLLNASGRGETLQYQHIAANKAVALSISGSTKAALDTFEALNTRLASSGHHTRGSMLFLVQYADVLVNVGRFRDAEPLYRQGLPIAQEAGNGRNISAFHIGLVKVHLAHEEIEPAQQQLDLARQYLTQGEPRPLAIAVAQYDATLARMTGQLSLAASRIDELLVQIGYPQALRGSGLLATIMEAAITHSQLGNHSRAISLAQGLVSRVEQSMSAREGNVWLGRALLIQAQAYAAAGNTEKAQNSVAQALPQLLQVQGEEGNWVQQAKRLQSRLATPPEKIAKK